MSTMYFQQCQDAHPDESAQLVSIIERAATSDEPTADTREKLLQLAVRVSFLQSEEAAHMRQLIKRFLGLLADTETHVWSQLSELCAGNMLAEFLHLSAEKMDQRFIALARSGETAAQMRDILRAETDRYEAAQDEREMLRSSIRQQASRIQRLTASYHELLRLYVDRFGNDDWSSVQMSDE